VKFVVLFLFGFCMALELQWTSVLNSCRTLLGDDL